MKALKEMQMVDPQHLTTDDSAAFLLASGAKALAHRRGVSMRTLRRRFSALGTTLSDFVCARRAALTMNLLQRPGSRVRDTAHELGFSSDVSFIRFVRREFGKTPGALREELSPERPRVQPEAPDGRACEPECEPEVHAGSGGANVSDPAGRSVRLP